MERSKEYYLAQIFYNFYLGLENLLSHQDPILVYQMGKVGSRTITESLKSLRLGRPIYHIHRLTQEGLDHLEEKATILHRSYPSKKYWIGLYLRRQMDKRKKRSPWKVVTLVRDPIAKNISAFFQGLAQWYPNFKLQPKHKNSSALLQELMEVFFQRYPHDQPLTWFDSEMKPVFGIDVFASEFPKSKGYKIYHRENVDVLLIRLEDINECVRQAFLDFLGIRQFFIVKANVGNEKDYSTYYQKFKNKIVLPDSYIDKMYTSKYAQHFYDKEEIEMFKMKWSRRGN